MGSYFKNVVEEVKNMSSEEKEELKFLIERYLVEERREEINRNYKNSLKELHDKKLDFTSDINKLKEIIKE